MQKNKPDTGKHLSAYARYSGLAFQMLVVILAGVFGGIKLDSFLHHKIPYFTIILSLLSVSLAIYLAVKDFIPPSSPRKRN